MPKVTSTRERVLCKRCTSKSFTMRFQVGENADLKEVERAIFEAHRRMPHHDRLQGEWSTSSLRRLLVFTGVVLSCGDNGDLRIKPREVVRRLQRTAEVVGETVWAHLGSREVDFEYPGRDQRIYLSRVI